MSQVTYPKVALPHRPRSLRMTALAALLAIVCAAALAAILLTPGGGDRSAAAPAAGPSAQILRSGAAPLETKVAAAVGTQLTAGPDESAIAASIGSR
jgi:hypothetical protein